MPPGGPDDAAVRRQIREAKQLGTAMQRSYAESAEEAMKAFDRIKASGDRTFDDLTDKIVDSIGNGSKEAAESMMDELVKMASKAPSQLKPHFDRLAAMAARTMNGKGGDASAAIVHMANIHSSTIGHAAAQTRRFASAQAAANKYIPKDDRNKFMSDSLVHADQLDKFEDFNNRRRQIRNVS